MRPARVGFLTRSHWLPGLVALFSGLLLVPPAPRSQFGTLSGRVIDQGGAPIVAAQVRIDGTDLGAVADQLGWYRIDSVPQGMVSATAAFVGYRPHRVIDIQITADSVTVVDFTMEQSAVDIGEIEVTAAENPLVPRDAVTTRQPPSAPSVIALQPGIVNTRGGRQDEAATYVDGVPVAPGAQGNQFVGSPQRMEQGSVTTGGASAEFGNAQPGYPYPGYPVRSDPGGENYKPIEENRFLSAAQTPVSTFSIDVDKASYSNVRRFLNSGTLPPLDAVRIEELVNYFSYRYPEPTGEHPFTVTLESNDCPWNPDHRLVLIGLQGRHVDLSEAPPSNLVFLLDVSGSMNEPDKLPLVKQAFRMLVAQMRPQDRVAIVVYAGAAGLVLPPTPGSHRAVIMQAIERLEAGGSTAGGDGIQLAYRVAQQQFRHEGNNRVILATDGDFNVGVSSEGELVRLIERYRESGIFLTVLGFGTGNLQDAKMEQLADKGNGHYAYVDNIREAHKVFVRELGGTLFTIAKDVKLQLEFNPALVSEYRLIGYENRVMAREDFDNDRKDAGELGAGHSVTALYEIVPAKPSVELVQNGSGSLRYQTIALTQRARQSREWMTVRLRYKAPEGSTSRLLEATLTGESGTRPSANFRFASAVAEFGLLLRNSENRGMASPRAVLARAQSALKDDEDGDRAEFLQLVRQYQHLRQFDD